jgi:hypothetical protein
MQRVTSRRYAKVLGLVAWTAVFALSACEKKRNPKVASGGGASTQAVVTLNGAAR